MPKLQKYFIASLSGEKTFFKTTTGLYKNALGAACGIFPALDAELDEPEVPVKNLLLAGKLIRLSAIALSNGKRQSIGLLSDKLSFPAVLVNAVGKNFSITNGSAGVIKSVNQKLRQIKKG